MDRQASRLAQRLASNAEAVCRYYLPNGKRSGRYWIVGNVSGEKGRSLYVNLAGDRAGRWTDAAVGLYGDLLDLIGLNRGHHDFRETLEEARYFLNEPRLPTPPAPAPKLIKRNSTVAARRLFAFSTPLPGTLAETYLRSRGITASLALPALKFHPACFFRPESTRLFKAGPR